jgi:hypothetical protein
MGPYWRRIVDRSIVNRWLRKPRDHCIAKGLALTVTIYIQASTTVFRPSLCYRNFACIFQEGWVPFCFELLEHVIFFLFPQNDSWHVSLNRHLCFISLHYCECYMFMNHISDCTWNIQFWGFFSCRRCSWNEKLSSVKVPWYGIIFSNKITFKRYLFITVIVNILVQCNTQTGYSPAWEQFIWME